MRHLLDRFCPFFPTPCAVLSPNKGVLKILEIETNNGINLRRISLVDQNRRFLMNHQ